MVAKPTFVDAVHAVMLAYLASLTDALERSLGGKVANAFLVPGQQVAPDFVCDGGQAWVRLAQGFPTVRFPNPGATPNSCVDPTGVQVQLGVVRCAPMPDRDGTLPSAEEQTQAALVALGDYGAMREAVLCASVRRSYVLGTYLPLGPAGDVVGGALTVTVQVV